MVMNCKRRGSEHWQGWTSATYKLGPPVTSIRRQAKVYGLRIKPTVRTNPCADLLLTCSTKSRWLVKILDNAGKTATLHFGSCRYSKSDASH